MSAQFEFVGTDQGPMLRGSSDTLLAELLVIFEVAAVAAGAPPASFRPGLQRGEIVSRLEGVGLGAPEELVVWFEWHDGEVTTQRADHVLPMASMASLDQALSRYSEATDNPSENWGAPFGWLPLVDANFGVAIDCMGPVADPPPIRSRREDFQFQDKSRAVSLCTLVAWWIFAIDAGALVRDPTTGRWGGDGRKSHSSQIEAFFF